MHATGVAAVLALAAMIQAAPIPDDDKLLIDRQFTIGDPWTGMWPPGKPPTNGGGVTIGPPITGGLNPSPPKAKRGADDDTIGIGGSQPTAEQARIKALQLEYETLLQKYGSASSSDRMRQIEKTLLREYGIVIVKAPDGTATTLIPGKTRRQFKLGPGLGGPLRPDPTVPGGKMRPDPVVPGGPIEISD